MAITLVFGLGVATVFVLFLVPAFVGIGGDVGRIVGGVWRWLNPPPVPVLPAPHPATPIAPPSGMRSRRSGGEVSFD